MIRVGVREEKRAQSEAERAQLFNDAGRRGPRVKDSRLARGRVINEVGVHGHVAKGRVELLQPLQAHGRGLPGIFRESDERRPVKLQRRRHAREHRLVHRAVLHRLQRGRLDIGGGGQRLRGQAKAELGFVDDIIEKVFEWQGHGGLMDYEGGREREIEIRNQKFEFRFS